MSFRDAIGFLYGLQKHGIKLGIEKTGRFLSSLNNPQDSFRSVHVAGTNGKGSVSAMTASILMSRGFKVGLFTSPHLVSFTERIRINHSQIPESEVIGITEELRSLLAHLTSEVPNPTFFEFVTAMAFLYFARHGVDWAVVEVGMGGRLDATNVLNPRVSVITKIGIDHKEFLGETLTDIAREKAGIIKQGVPVVSAAQEREAGEMITATADARSSPLSVYGRDFHGVLSSSGLEGVRFDYRDGSGEIADLFTPLAGAHQLQNACIAINAATVALGRDGERPGVTDAGISDSYGISASAIREGLARTRWSGRMELISRNPAIMIDGAHNPDAARALSEFMRTHLAGYHIILVIGVMADKDMAGIMKPLLPCAAEIVFTAPSYERAARPETLAAFASSAGFSSEVTKSVREAIGYARKKAVGQQALILITGSFYTIGEAKEVLGEEAILGRLREKL